MRRISVLKGAAIPGLEVCVAAVVDAAGFCAKGGGACMPRIVALVRTVWSFKYMIEVYTEAETCFTRARA
jgi:hypothetical protein